MTYGDMQCDEDGGISYDNPIRKEAVITSETPDYTESLREFTRLYWQLLDDTTLSNQ